MNTAVKTAKTASDTAMTQGWISTMLAHVPEYLCEAAGLGTFMLSACIFGVLLNHPGSSVNQTIENPLLRRVLGGVAMGLTAICIFRSPFGQRSGAHINPAVTTSFWLLGKIRTPDAIGYVVSQFAGAVAGVIVADLILGMPLRHAAVNYSVTLRWTGGPWVALAAELSSPS